eukprot:jgi/Bigna1/42229/e_gw1.62.17.1
MLWVLAGGRRQDSAILDFFRQLAAGGGASAIAKTAMAPFERIRILLQNQNMIGDPNYVKYKGPIDAMFRIPQEQGIMSFWRLGNLANCIRIMPTYGIRFSSPCHSPGRWPLGPFQVRLAVGQMLNNVALSLDTGATTMIFTYPLDILRTRLTTDITKVSANTAPLHCLYLAGEGKAAVLGFYKGIRISILEIAPYTAIAMGGYEYLRKYAGSKTMLQQSINFGLIIVVFLPFFVLQGSLICYPLDTVKRQMMLDGARGYQSKYKGEIARCIRIIHATYGIKGFYGGCLLNALKVNSSFYSEIGTQLSL